MRPLFCISDVHIGAIRSGGTTPTTALQLRQQLLIGFGGLLDQCEGGSVILNGDLFDAFNVPYTDVWRTVELCKQFLDKNSESILYAAAGNHDRSKNTTVMSSFDLYCKFMVMLFPDRFVAIHEPTAIPKHDAYVVPHLLNQDLVNEALKKVPKCKRLFVHMNYENKFAVEADHSLNMSASQAEALPVDRIVFGHEHIGRSELAGKVVIVGNQLCSSVADALGNTAKYFLKITDAGIEHIPCWDRESPAGLSQPDWRTLSTYSENRQFIRVVGEATAAEASLVVAAISKLRSKSDALVITNAVTIDGIKADETARMSLESMKSFDVYNELLGMLDADEVITIKNIVEKHCVPTTQAE